MSLFSDPNVDKWTQKSKFRSKICSFWQFLGVIFDHFGSQEGRFLDFFKVILVLFRDLESIVFRYLYSLLPITPALLWGPADALLNIDKASPGLFINDISAKIFKKFFKWTKIQLQISKSGVFWGTKCSANFLKLQS